MTRTVAALLLSIVTMPLCAQGGGDYGISFLTDGVTRVPLHKRVAFIAVLNRPAGGGEVVVELDVPGNDLEFDGNCTGPKPVRCTLPPGYDMVRVFATLHTPGTFTATARVIAVNDGNPQNDHDSWTLEVVDKPSLTVMVHSGAHEPARAGKVWASVVNSGADAQDVVLTLTLPDGGIFTTSIDSPDATCIVTGPATMICSRPLLASGGRFEVRAEVVAPDRLDGGTFPLEASVRSGAADFDPADDATVVPLRLTRNLVVTNTNDQGAGSLRQALLDAQQLCALELCTVAFRVPVVRHDGRVVIEPRSQLPELRGLVKLDGGTQTFFYGDTNPDGPEVVLDGSLAPEGTHGLLLGGPSCSMYVLELAVMNFHAPGIQAHRGTRDYIGCAGIIPNTLIAGNHISGNYRGVVVAGPGDVRIADNVIHDNRRAGIFADRSSYVEILRNRITGNGASGIFLNPFQPFGFTAAVVEENLISGNREWGIARTPTGDARIQRNAIFGNRHLGIDMGLDFETPNRLEDPSWEPGVPNKPVLFSAHYDPAANKTRVRGRLDSITSIVSMFVIDVYASTSLSALGQAEAGQWLAYLLLPREDSQPVEFEVELDGDLRGKYITATNTRRHLVNWEDFAWDTSELSNPVQVP